MFPKRYTTGLKRDPAAGSPVEAGWVNEIINRSQWLLGDLLSVLSFVPHLVSRKSLLPRAKQDIGIKHMNWVNGMISNLNMLPESLTTFCNLVAKPWFSPLSFAWFDPKLRGHRKRGAGVERPPEENRNEGKVNYPGNDGVQQILEFPHGGESGENKGYGSIPAPFLSSKFTFRPRRSPAVIGFPQLPQQQEKPVPSLIQPTADEGSSQMNSVGASNRPADDRELYGQALPIDKDGNRFKSAGKSTGPVRPFIPVGLSSSNVNALLQAGRVANQPGDEMEIPLLAKYTAGTGEKSPGGGGPAHAKPFSRFLPGFLQRLSQQKEPVTLAKMLTEKAQWLSHKKETKWLPVFNISVAGMGLGPRIPDPDFSPGTPDICVPPVPEDNEKVASSTQDYIPFSSLSFGPITNQVPAERYWADHGDIHGSTSSHEDMAVMAVGALAPAGPGRRAFGGSYGTGGIELALAPVARSTGPSTAQETVPAGDQGMASTPETEEKPALDHEALASEVYGILKRRLLVEKERAQGMR